MHAAAVVKDCMYVFGGLDENQECSAMLYALSCENWNWTELGRFCVDGSEIRMCGHTAVAFEDRVLIFGGLDPSTTTIYNQIFEYHVCEKVWGREDKRRAPRFCGGLVIAGGKLVLLGGCNLVNRVVPGLEEEEIARLSIDLLG